MKYLFFLLTIFVFANCNQETKTVSNFEFYPPISDSLSSKEINQTLNLWKTWYTDQFNLSPLYSGTNDSLIIRFWPWNAFEKWTSMFEFRLDSSGWKGHHYFLKSYPDSVIQIDANRNAADSLFITRRIVPRCGWDKFYDSLNLFGLRSLPTEFLIKNFKKRNLMDGSGYVFEIATEKSYRRIDYANPYAYSYKECKQIIEIVGVIARQVGDDHFWPWK